MIKHRKQTQHWRRYRSGRYTLINRGIRYKKTKSYAGLIFGYQIPLQLHMGKEFTKLRQLEQEVRKPAGLWTSTYTPEGGSESEWVEWVRYNEPMRYNEPGWHKSTGILLRPSKSARIFEIDTTEDIRELFQKYGVLSFGEHPDFDWENVSKDYDAVRVTSKAAKEFHGLTDAVDVSDIVKSKFPKEFEEIKIKWGREPSLFNIDLNVWDIESTVWFKDVFEEKKKIDIKSKPVEDEQENEI